ncbi:MAG TPA: hypothetical protein VFS51_06665, partial [Gemmatimonadales bacterium]|nr:hypothetical protein [Gemmatimonadales bacterium]
MVATGLAAGAGGVSAQTPSAPGGIVARESQSIRLSRENVRLNNYLHDLAGPPAVAGLIGSGLLDQLREQPEFWNDGVDGLPRRIASRATQAAVQVSVRHGLAALMH